MVNVSILGAGQVGLPLIELLNKDDRFNIVAVAVNNKLKNRIFNKTLIMDMESAATEAAADIVVDALPDSADPLRTARMALEAGKDLVICNKGLIMHMGYLASIASQNNKTIMLNSLVSNASFNYNLVPEDITDKTIHKYDQGFLSEFRGGDGPVTAKFIYEDLIRLAERNK